MKRWIVAALAAGMVSMGCQTLGLTDPDAIKPKPVAKADSGTPSAPGWRVEVGASDRLTRMEPVVVDKSVFSASQGGTISAHTITGQPLWTAKTNFKIQSGVGADDHIVVAGGKKGELLAVNAKNGKQLWKAKVGSEVVVPPVVTPSVVAVRTMDGRIFGLNRKDGKRKWIYQRILPALILGKAGPMTLAQDFIFIGYPGGKLIALQHDKGALVFEENVSTPKGDNELERLTDVSSKPVIYDPQVCVGAYQGRVGCFSLRGGSAMWFKDLSSSAGVAIDDNAVYVAADDGYLYALDKDLGTEKWKSEVLAGDRLFRPVVSNNYIVVGDSFGFLHFFNRETGKFAGRLSVDGSQLTAPPVVLPDGSLIVQTTGGRLARYGITGG